MLSRIKEPLQKYIAPPEFEEYNLEAFFVKVQFFNLCVYASTVVPSIYKAPPPLFSAVLFVKVQFSMVDVIFFPKRATAPPASVPEETVLPSKLQLEIFSVAVAVLSVKFRQTAPPSVDEFILFSKLQ